MSQSGRQLRLSASHLQLAAQVPSQWARTPIAFADTILAFRKMSWRALLAKILFNRSHERPLDDGSAPQLKRLGRLNDSVYNSWESFIAAAEKRLDVKVIGEVTRDRVMESRLEVFHFLRCILGPVIESFLLLDRKMWLRQQLEVRVALMLRCRHRYSWELSGVGCRNECSARKFIRSELR